MYSRKRAKHLLSPSVYPSNISAAHSSSYHGKHNNRPVYHRPLWVLGLGRLTASHSKPMHLSDGGVPGNALSIARLLVCSPANQIMWGWSEDMTTALKQKCLTLKARWRLNNKNGDHGIEETGLCNDEWQNDNFMNITLTKTSEAYHVKYSAFFRVWDPAPCTAIFLNMSLPLLSIRYVACAMIDSTYIALYYELCHQGKGYAVVITIEFSGGVVLVWMEGMGRTVWQSQTKRCPSSLMNTLDLLPLFRQSQCALSPAETSLPNFHLSRLCDCSSLQNLVCLWGGLYWRAPMSA